MEDWEVAEKLQQALSSEVYAHDATKRKLRQGGEWEKAWKAAAKYWRYEYWRLREYYTKQPPPPADDGDGE